MAVEGVTKEAGVAAGLFYHYFKDLKSLTMEVLTDFVGESANIEAIEKVQEANKAALSPPRGKRPWLARTGTSLKRAVTQRLKMGSLDELEA